MRYTEQSTRFAVLSQRYEREVRGVSERLSVLFPHRVARGLAAQSRSVQCPLAEHGMAAITVSSRADQLRHSLDSSHQISQEACRVLDQYCNQLSDLERIVQPIVLKTRALSQTRENVKQARAKAEEVLDHLDASRKVI